MPSGSEIEAVLVVGVVGPGLQAGREALPLRLRQRCQVCAGSTLLCGSDITRRPLALLRSAPQLLQQARGVAGEVGRAREEPVGGGPPLHVAA